MEKQLNEISLDDCQEGKIMESFLISEIMDNCQEAITLINALEMVSNFDINEPMKEKVPAQLVKLQYAIKLMAEVL